MTIHLIPSLCLVVTILATACRSTEMPTKCAYVVDEVGLDEVVPAVIDVVPRNIIDAITQPVTGTLQWHGADEMEWITVSPGTGSTEFMSTATHEGPITWSRVPDAVGDELLRCEPTLMFALEIKFETEDGVFNDSWQGSATYSLLTFSGTTVEVDASAERIPDRLDLEQNPSPPQPVFNPRYIHNMSYGEVDGSTRTEGSIQFLADFEESRDGDIINGGGIFLRLATWSNIDDG